MTMIGSVSARCVAALAFIGVVSMLIGCGTPAAAQNSITLAAVVVDGQRAAQANESGLVRVYRGDRWIDGRAEMSLQPGDQVVTGPTAYALIRYPSGTEVYMRPDSRGRIGSFTDFVGEVFAKIRGAFAIQTSFVSAGAEGTAYLVRSTSSGEATVVVFDGIVNVASLTNAWAPVKLGAGAMTVASAPAGRAAAAPQPMRASTDEVNRARAWVERVERLAPPPPPQYGGHAATTLAVGGLAALIIANHEREDRDAAASSHPTPLAAPPRAVPGSPIAERPSLVYDCRSLALSWAGVDGASDYAVVIAAAPLATPTAWRRLPATTVRETRIAVGEMLRLNNVYRWTVQARNAQGQAGAASTPLHFACVGDTRTR